VTTICTVTMDPHFVYSSSSSYMSRFLWPSSIEMCRKSMYFAYSAIGYRRDMFRSDVVKRRYQGFSYLYRRSSRMLSRTSGGAALEALDDHGGPAQVVEDRLHVFRGHVDPAVLDVPAVAERTGEVASARELERAVEGIDGFLRHLVPEGPSRDLEEPPFRDLPHDPLAPPFPSAG